MNFKSLVLLAVFSFLSLSLNAQGVASVKTSYNVLSDGNIEVSFTMEVQDGWYVYSTEKVSGGPMPTSFYADGSQDYELVGSLFDAEKAHVKLDEGFQLEVGYFEGTAVFKQIIKPLTGKAFTLNGLLEYQTCNGGECLLNDNEISLSFIRSGCSCFP